MSRILVIEDDDGIRENLRELLQMEGHTVIEGRDGEEGVRLALMDPPDLIICDITMPEMDGYSVLGSLKKFHKTAHVPFIFLTARAARSDVRRGMNLGASDYIPKPFARAEILESVDARLRQQSFREEIITKPGTRRTEGQRLVLTDPQMKRLFEQVDRVAKGVISVLILGETGVGKEVLAEEVHRRSGRKGAFIALNCAALSENLLESELFGHEKGSFTGAVGSKKGLFEAADGGTLFLDEVGEMPVGTQVKLLRVLETRSVMRVGGHTTRPIDVRFVAATNQDITRETDQSLFRRDLLYRLNGATLHVPPLRERRGDIVPLAEKFIERCSELSRSTCPNLSDEAKQWLQSQLWAGNIRELRNVIERGVLLCDGPILEPSHLCEELGAPASGFGEKGQAGGIDRERLTQQLAELERQRVVEALASCAGNQTQAANLLGISRRTLVTRLEDYGLPRPRKGK